MASTALAEARKNLDNYKARLSSLRKRAEEETTHVVRHGAALVFGGAMGAAEARFGARYVVGLDVPLATAIAAGGAAFTGLGGKEAQPFLRAAVDAGLAITGFKEGYDMMRQRMVRAGTPAPATPGGTSSGS